MGKRETAMKPTKSTKKEREQALGRIAELGKQSDKLKKERDIEEASTKKGSTGAKMTALQTNKVPSTHKQEGCCEKCKDWEFHDGPSCPCHLQAQVEYLNKFAEEIGYDPNAPVKKNGEVSHTREEGWEKEFDEILIGIDKHEGESEDGWWETSTGAEFGKKKKEELRLFIMSVREDAYETGYEDGENSMLADFVGAEDLSPAGTVFEVIEQIKKKAREDAVREERGRLVAEVESALENYFNGTYPIPDHRVIGGYLRQALLHKDK